MRFRGLEKSNEIEYNIVIRLYGEFQKKAV